ncbi:helix-hairpin-helix domain-containing protein [Chakrabartyella piscis]|uniref:ComEA family DNA-binding protein n=1 Tax=Chakrabartyella piscis TaxID=2918914 RepID=UPI002958DCED|nr:helix-hairpin-helix domain-containing protein [Chakrabartyella piscis]
MDKKVKKQVKNLVSHKILILVFFGLFFYTTNVYFLEHETVELSFGEPRTAQELLYIWGQEGAVYPAGMLEQIDLNTATEEQLKLLPGIGEVLSKRILEYREVIGAFTSILELDDVEGIGIKTIESISDYICI